MASLRKSSMRGVRFGLSVALGVTTVGSVFAGGTAMAADPLPVHAMRTVQFADPITPKSAADARAPMQSQAKTMHDGGDDVGAANMLMREAERLKDPVLYLDAADAFLAVAEADTNQQWLDGAQQMADVALDMLYQLRDNGGSAAWQPVADEHVGLVLERAQSFEQRAQAARERIEAAAEGEDEAPEGPVKPAKKGAKGLFIAGAALTGVGVLGLGAAGAGMAIGAKAQREVTDPLVYQAAHEAAEARGRTGNILAYIGGGLGVVGVGAGVALMVIAKKRDKAGGGSDANPADDAGDTAADDPTVAIIPGLRGLTIKGTF